MGYRQIAYWRSIGFSDNLKVQKWGDRAVVFNVLSGQTHLLDDFSIAVLEILDLQTFSIDDLKKQMLETYEIESTRLDHMLVMVIKEFDKLGLIKQF